MSEIMALGYVVISASDLDAWSSFGQHGLGLQLGTAPDPETLCFRVDERSWRFAVEQGEDGGLVALGFEVASEADLAGLRARLEAAGVRATEAPELAARRRVGELVQVSDPSGVHLEFYCRAEIASTPLLSPTGARFVTGAQGFGHAVVTVDDVAATTAFYRDLLGFRLSDVITLGGLLDIHFTSPSRRHHSLGYVSPAGVPGGRLEHVMVEVDDLDVVGRALDWCLDNKIEMRAMLGKHVNDHMISFYCYSPSGLAVEYGWGGRQIPQEGHQISHYTTSNVWGHRPPDGRNVEEEIAAILSGAAPAQGDPS